MTVILTLSALIRPVPGYVHARLDTRERDKLALVMSFAIALQIRCCEYRELCQHWENRCLSSKCVNDSITCKLNEIFSQVTSFTCLPDTDECTFGLHDCDPNALCTNIAGTWTCVCKTGYSGSGQTCTGNFDLILIWENTH